jgi:hypothetical protein
VVDVEEDFLKTSEDCMRALERVGSEYHFEAGRLFMTIF